MEYRKLDAALSASLAGAPGKPLQVFISFKEPRSEEVLKQLRKYGIDADVGQSVVTASASPKTIEALSDLQCVRSIKLSGMSRLL